MPRCAAASDECRCRRRPPTTRTRQPSGIDSPVWLCTRQTCAIRLVIPGFGLSRNIDSSSKSRRAVVDSSIRANHSSRQEVGCSSRSRSPRKGSVLSASQRSLGATGREDARLQQRKRFSARIFGLISTRTSSMTRADVVRGCQCVASGLSPSPTDNADPAASESRLAVSAGSSALRLVLKGVTDAGITQPQTPSQRDRRRPRCR